MRRAPKYHIQIEWNNRHFAVLAETKTEAGVRRVGRGLQRVMRARAEKPAVGVRITCASHGARARSVWTYVYIAARGMMP